MATNEGLKPVSNDATPVDPNVRVPDHVTRAAAEAEAIHQRAYPKEAPAPAAPAKEAVPQPDQPEPLHQQAAEQQADPGPQQVDRQQQLTPQPAQPQQIPDPAPQDQNVSADEWRHRFLSMQGRYKAATNTIGAMEQQMAELGQELVRTQNLLAARPQEQAVNHDISQPVHNKLITDEDRANYGDELIDLARRAGREAVAPEIEALRAENERLTNQVKSTSKRELFTTLDGKLPQWRQINQDIRFKSWLRLPNVYTQQLRSEMLKKAVDGANAPQVLQLFRDFLTEATATGQMAPAQQVEQQAAPAPRTPAVNLESLAAPGRARPASGDSQVPTEKPIYSRADISKFYRDKQRGLYAGREAEFASTERDLEAAQREGRIRG